MISLRYDSERKERDRDKARGREKRGADEMRQEGTQDRDSGERFNENQKRRVTFWTSTDIHHQQYGRG